ncbi:hypothetical protein CAPTEDRAFT_189544 [Capitella teleta]|uniref:Uncharacterized protein n=1 Tax=Capitella teleta TaxID=283909 RepID=R7UQL1_CAPTE|nr:hypothetical protein CAPTEDRAFT_189544 [Capitella teleta]|eukprot:ELU05696.1 hypothetical protein CAPTEDRAFT_189544 [Capitella teleta]
MQGGDPVPCKVKKAEYCGHAEHADILANWPGDPSTVSVRPVSKFSGDDVEWSAEMSWRLPQDGGYIHLTGFQLYLHPLADSGFPPPSTCYTFKVNLTNYLNNSEAAIQIWFKFNCMVDLLPDHEYQVNLFSLPLRPPSDLVDSKGAELKFRTVVPPDPSTTTLPPSTSTEMTPTQSEPPSTLSSGQIAGICIGVAILVVLIIVMIFVYVSTDKPLKFFLQCLCRREDVDIGRPPSPPIGHLEVTHKDIEDKINDKIKADNDKFDHDLSIIGPESSYR